MVIHHLRAKLSVSVRHLSSGRSLLHKLFITTSALVAASLVIFIAPPAYALSASSYSATGANSASISVSTSGTAANGTVTVSGTGYDYRADGLGPYVKESFRSSNNTETGYYTASCAAGAGKHCSLPVHSVNNSSYVLFAVCDGSDGAIILGSCSSYMTVYPD